MSNIHSKHATAEFREGHERIYGNKDKVAAVEVAEVAVAPVSEKEQRIREKLAPVICEWLGVREGEYNFDSRFEEDLNADSLDRLEMCMALEEEFELEISDATAETFVTVQNVVDYLVQNVKD